MFGLFLALSVALAGDLSVTTNTPVLVWMDGVNLGYSPGTMTASIGGVSGIHSLEITSATGQRLASANVNVPAVGLVQFQYDGRSLSQLQAVAPQPQIVLVQVPAPVAAPAAPKAPTAMSSSAFASLVATVEGTSFGDEQVAAVRAAAARNHFTVAQVGQLMDLLSFGDDKIALVKAARPKIIDPENGFELANRLTFGDDKTAVMALF